MKQVLIIGGGFAGLNAAKVLGVKDGVEVPLIDRENHHVFQPFLYQVAMAGLSPADIAAPIRSILSRYSNIRVGRSHWRGEPLHARQGLSIDQCGIHSFTSIT